MASSEVDQKFLGKLAKSVEKDNPLLASVLFKILGLSINLSSQLVSARKQRKTDTTTSASSLELYFHIIWLSREGLVLLEQYVLPMVGNYVELKVLAFKLRASFYHIFVLFHNTPPVSTLGIGTPEGQTTSTPPPTRVDKGKGIARDDDLDTQYSSLQNPPTFEGGPVHPPPGFGPEPPTAFLLKPGDYLPTAHRCFQEAVQLAEKLLWGSHSLRLSVKTEYAAFLYECVHDAEGSRKLAKETVAEVYDATEGIDNDMFNDACELVTVLGKMMKRGLGSSNTLRSKAQGSGSGTQGTPKTEQAETSAGPKVEPPPQNVKSDPRYTQGFAPQAAGDNNNKPVPPPVANPGLYAPPPGMI
ncbi:14-3-3 domain-containing protein [Diplogelasinospora grovesii]|uniref:14-3-3 domain-containing protein n=1 Tax=Diplogelasinospora grovesii TaxID=303347 RepID=A0AAN6N8I5_9PEZI|nr:14-3-3 domain-containing protein [Diplogelasinospora grovesii]